MSKRTLQPQKKLLGQELQKFLRTCETAGKSERTREQYRDAVKRLMELTGDIQVESLAQEDIGQFTLGLKETLAPGSVNYYLRGLRAFVNHLQLNVSVTMVKETKKQIIPFSEAQIRKFFQVINKNTFVGVRDDTLFNLLFDTGVRVSEATGICKEDIVGANIKVLGKGQKERIVPVGSHTLSKLQGYLEQVDDLPEDVPIFISENNVPLNRHTVNDRIRLYAKKAKIKGVRPSCHTFRHTFARAYLLNGGDMYTLQRILGHETLDMVRQYVFLFTSDIEAMHKKYSPGDSLFKKREKK